MTTQEKLLMGGGGGGGVSKFLKCRLILNNYICLKCSIIIKLYIFTEKMSPDYKVIYFVSVFIQRTSRLCLIMACAELSRKALRESI